MVSSTHAKKPHVVCVPFPAQGHINPFMQLATILHKLGSYITFVNTEYNQRRLLNSHGADHVHGQPDFSFETIPDGLPPPPEGFDAIQDIPLLCDSTRKNFYEPFKNLMLKLIDSPDVPPISLVFGDGIMGFSVKVARELGIPDAQFWTASACGFLGSLQFHELEERGIVPFKYENFTIDGIWDAPINWIQGMPNIRLRDLPTFVRVTNSDDILFNFLKLESEDCLKSSKIIINTFYDIEKEVLDVLISKNPNIYSIGPFHLLGKNFIENEEGLSGSSLWKSDFECLKWLNKWEENSVIYVSFGNTTVMSEEMLMEIAWGLANSKVPFLWVVRPDMTRKGENYSDAAGSLPEEFLLEIKDRGYITSWSPQNQVLAHPAVAVFLTHCGWNSTLESISEGKPLVCWPFFAEQQTNCWYANRSWGNGVEINPDVKSGEVAALLIEAIHGEKGKLIRDRALQWKEKAIKATEMGGSSYHSFYSFVKEALSLSIVELV